MCWRFLACSPIPYLYVLPNPKDKHIFKKILSWPLGKNFFIACEDSRALFIILYFPTHTIRRFLETFFTNYSLSFFSLRRSFFRSWHWLPSQKIRLIPVYLVTRLVYPAAFPQLVISVTSQVPVSYEIRTYTYTCILTFWYFRRSKVRTGNSEERIEMGPSCTKLLQHYHTKVWFKHETTCAQIDCRSSVWPTDRLISPPLGGSLFTAS